MKKLTLILFTFLMVLTFKSFGQKLEVNKTDDFTKKSVKQTSWETLFQTFKGMAYFRISVTDTTATFDLKFQNDKMNTGMKGDQLMFAMDNGQVVTLTNLEDAFSCRGCGARGINGSGTLGIQMTFALSKDQIQKLKTGKITKMRIGFTTGAFDEDVKAKNAGKVPAALNLL